MDEQLAFLRLIAARLHAAGIPYMVTGALAQAVWAVPRMTRDIDVVVEVGPADARQLVAAVEELDWGYLQTWAVELGVRDALERIEGS